MTRVIDCETVRFSPGNMAPPIIATGVEKGGHSFITTKPLEPSQLSDIVGFSIAYDMACYAAIDDRYQNAVFNAYECGSILDLRLRSLLHDYARLGMRESAKRGYGLDSVSKAYGVAPHRCKDSEWRTRYEELADVPIAQWPEEAKEYLREDVRVTADLWSLTTPQEDERNQSRYDFALRMVSNHGLMVDPTAVRELEKSIQARINEMRPALESEGLLRHNGSRDMTAIRALARQCGMTRVTPTGKLSVGAKALREATHPALVALAEYQAAIAVRDREIKLLREAPYVHTRFDLAVSGRSTSANPNLQNLSKRWGVRECFRPRPGYVFLVVDYPALELRTLAQCAISLLGHRLDRFPLCEAFQRGVDPHLLFARQRLGADPDEPKPPERQLAKAANFGFPGGLQGENFAQFAKDVYGLEVPDPDGLRKQWFAQWPEVRRYMAKSSRLARRGPIKQIGSGRLRGQCSSTQAANTFFQGLGADVAKDTLWHIVRECHVGDMRPCRPVAFVHDEFVVEAPVEDARKHAQTLECIIRDVWPRWCPDVPVGDVEVEIKKRWGK